MKYSFSLKGILLIFLSFLVFLFIESCSDKSKQTKQSLTGTESQPFESDSIEIDLDQMVDFNFNQIKERGTIRIALENNSTGYFLYKGRPMGFQYELINNFCNKNNLQMEIVLENNFYKSFQMLVKGEVDVIAHSLTITRNRKEIVSFIDPLYEVRQMLVQHKPEGWEEMKKHQIENKLLRSPSELIGKEIHVRKGSSFLNRLHNLSDEIGGDIIIVEEGSEVTTEDLIVMVAYKSIEYTVADEDLADVGATYFDNIDVQTPISLPTQVSWAVRKNSPQLKEQLNKWLLDLKRKPDFNVLFKKYFEDPKSFKQRARSDFSTISGNKISPYDDLIKKYAKSIEWDWRLLAALIYQESEFNPNASSWVGAKGLMQLMPATAKEFGAQNILDPEQNIMSGTNYLKWLKAYWEKYIDDIKEQNKFIIASYNAGQGHVLDAMKLAEKYDKDPHKWDENVAYYLLLKSKPNYYKDPVVQSGYCRGVEPVNYVNSISEQFEIYKQFFD